MTFQHTRLELITDDFATLKEERAAIIDELHRIVEDGIQEGEEFHIIVLVRRLALTCTARDQQHYIALEEETMCLLNSLRSFRVTTPGEGRKLKKRRQEIEALKGGKIIDIAPYLERNKGGHPSEPDAA